MQRSGASCSLSPRPQEAHLGVWESFEAGSQGLPHPGFGEVGAWGVNPLSLEGITVRGEQKQNPETVDETVPSSAEVYLLSAHCVPGARLE